jgi:3-dehydroquinate dehydratase II
MSEASERKPAPQGAAKLTIAVVHGPNLNLLGQREPDRYGTTTLTDINDGLSEDAQKVGVTLDFFQANSEGELVTHIQSISQRCDGILINPAAYTHTSVAIRDALIASTRPTVEVHLTNTYAREPFRHRSLIADIVVARIMGFGALSYKLGLKGLIELLQQDDS